MGDVLGREHWQAANVNRWNRAWGMGEQAPAVVVGAIATRYRVSVVFAAYADEEKLAGDYDTHAEALASASRIAERYGWPVSDLVAAAG